VIDGPDGRKLKIYRGMGSKEAMAEGSAARYGHESTKKIGSKVAAEGVVGKKPFVGPAADILAQYL